MTELYTMQRYLQQGLLEQKRMTHFDNWASTFGETVTAIELAPEGTGYRARTRFSRFKNLPEMIAMRGSGSFPARNCSPAERRHAPGRSC